MIFSVQGKITSKYPGHTCVETSPGLILDVFTPVSYYTSLKNDESVSFYTVLKIRDEDPQMYGFLTLREKEFFLKMISISGVGSKTALMIISAFSINEFVKMIESSDVLKLSSIPGIGKKTAQRIILELTGKISFGDDEATEDSRLKSDLISALVNLGYNLRNVKNTVEGVMREGSGDQTFESLFKIILKKISAL